MNKKHFACAVAAIFVSTAFLSGCATAPPAAAAAQSSDAFNKSMAEADVVASAAENDRAIRLYQKIATDNPSKGEPWSRIAQIHFAQSNYSLAIVAAEETLRRDPSSRQAKSITAVGGLRLAARSLEDLRKDSSLSGDTTADAQRLAGLLRETLGTAVLVPAAGPARPAAVRRPTPSAAASPPATAAPPAPPVAKSAASPSRASGGGNPFDALK